MDSFEQVVATVLHRQGYWLLPSLKVELSKAEKRRIGRQSSPRWEIDVVAYDAKANKVIAVECKSYMDSSGVQVATFDGRNKPDRARYKMFFEPTLRRVVLKALARQLVRDGFCRKNPAVTLGLAAGKIKGDREWLRAYFEKKDWLLFTPDDIRSSLADMRDEGYENTVAAIVAKLLLRNESRNMMTPNQRLELAGHGRAKSPALRHSKGAAVETKNSLVLSRRPQLKRER